MLVNSVLANIRVHASAVHGTPSDTPQVTRQRTKPNVHPQVSRAILCAQW